MLIRAGYEISSDGPAPTPITLLLSVRPERFADLVTNQRIAVSGPPPLHLFQELYGNNAHRLQAPAGHTLVRGGPPRRPTPKAGVSVAVSRIWRWRSAGASTFPLATARDTSGISVSRPSTPLWTSASGSRFVSAALGARWTPAITPPGSAEFRWPMAGTRRTWPPPLHSAPLTSSL